jgi:ATP-dependent Clp protease ATP-binding subunit ClpX
MCEPPTMQGAEEAVVNAEVVEGRAQPLLICAEKKGGQASA